MPAASFIKMGKEVKDIANRSVVIITVEKPPELVENNAVACACGGTLVYGSFPLKTKWLGREIEVTGAYGWKCSSCNVTLLHPFVGDQLREKMVQTHTTSTPC